MTCVLVLILGAAKFPQGTIPRTQRDPVIITLEEILYVKHCESYLNSMTHWNGYVPHTV